MQNEEYWIACAEEAAEELELDLTPAQIYLLANSMYSASRSEGYAVNRPD